MVLPEGINIAKLNINAGRRFHHRVRNYIFWAARRRLYSQFQLPIMIGTSYCMHFSLKKPI